MRSAIAVFGALTSLALVSVAAAGPPTPAPVGGPATVAPLGGPTSVAAYGGTEAWSDFDAATGSWQVVVRRNGKFSTPSIPASKTSPEVAVGPGPSGPAAAPVLTYLTCAATCQVVVSAVDGSDSQTVPGSSGASHPTIWGDRVAWVRGAATVVTSLVDGSARTTVGGAPKSKCYYTYTTGRNRRKPVRKLACARPRDPVVDAVTLYGQKLALIDTFEIDDGVGAHGTVTEVRTESVAGGAQQVVAVMDVGEGDESWVGPSWADGKLYFYKTSLGAGYAVDGFDPAHGTYVTAKGDSGYLTGFAVIDGGQRAYETTFPGDPDGGISCSYRGPGGCELVLSAPFAFKPSKSLVFVP